MGNEVGEIETKALYDELKRCYESRKEKIRIEIHEYITHFTRSVFFGTSQFSYRHSR